MSSLQPSLPSNRKRSHKKEIDQIVIIGAYEHNLQIESLRVPKHKMIVFTGVSGSGKSSLAFDTLYAEGQRRYIESLNAYARQFLGRLDRPKVEHIRGLSPTIAIEQKSASNNPRSTVGTITEVYDYLRVLYAKLGTQHCHFCGNPVRTQSSEEIVREVLTLPEGSKILIIAPVVNLRKGEFKDLIKEIKERGFLHIRIDGESFRLEQPPELDKRRKHTIELIIDRITLRARDRARLTESIELALRESNGEVIIEDKEDSTKSIRFSEIRACCNHSFPDLSPQSFSFNSPIGMCQACNGLGTRMEVDPDLIVPNTDLSIRQGAIAPWATAMARGENWTSRIIEAMSRACNVDLDVPWSKLSKKKRQDVLYGLGNQRIRVTWGKKGTIDHGSWGIRYEGILHTIMRRYQQTNSEAARTHYRKFMREGICETCQGQRLRPESLNVVLADKRIAEVTAMTVRNAFQHFSAIQLDGTQKAIAKGALKEVCGRLQFLLNVGLDYLTIDRSGPSLSGGETQRIRLASQLGSELSGVMYVLDEPSIGLHQRDNLRLIQTLKGLRDQGNTVIVVEHDEETIRSADWVVDFGPGAGHKGGKVVFGGTPKQLIRHSNSLTGRYLAKKSYIAVPEKRRSPKAYLKIKHATINNLKNIDVDIPLGVFVAVTGVSGAGKSSLINGILLPSLSRSLHSKHRKMKGANTIECTRNLNRVIAIDQKPIGRTPRSNPGTYTKSFDEIRSIFAQLPESRLRGYLPGRFSFNVKGGRCDACNGDGVVKVEMHFLADVYVPCEVCLGKRYNTQTLQIQYKGHSIADILDLSVNDCLKLFDKYPNLCRILQTLSDVGLGYIKIGQSAPTLSGGEAQRIKLSRELGKNSNGHTLYILDEPTTGLHFDDIKRLLEVLQRLVDLGNTVVVIEHNLEVIKSVDWVIDLGPEGGELGGYVVAKGPPEEIAEVSNSHTGRCLMPVLNTYQTVYE